MKLIDELDGKLSNLWKFWSVRFNVVAGACSATVAVYEGFKAVDPELVKHIPVWPIVALALGAIWCTFTSIIVRGIPQPSLRDASCTDDQAKHDV